MTYPKGYEKMPAGSASSDVYEKLSTGHGEVTIWQRELKTGLFRRKVVGVEKVTNYAVYDSNNEHSIPLYELEDIVIMNAHSQSQSRFMGTSSGSKGSRVGYGIGHGRSNRVADVLFMVAGVPAISFKSVNDPQGLKNLVVAAKESLMKNMKND